MSHTLEENRMRVPRFVNVFAALLVALFLALLAAPVLFGQDSTAVSPPAEPTKGLMALALASVSLVSFLLWQGLKRLGSGIDQLPAFTQRVVVLVIAAVLTAAGTMAGLPLPTTLDALTQSDLTALLTWGATILFGGGGSMAAHAGKVALLGRRTL